MPVWTWASSNRAARIKIYARGTRVRPNRGADLQPNSGARPVYPVAIETQPRMTNSASVPIPRSAAQLTSTAIPYFRSNRGSISCSMSAPPENRGARHLCQMAEQTGTQPRVRHWPEGKEAWERCAGPLSGADRTCVSGLSTAGHDPQQKFGVSRARLLTRGGCSAPEKANSVVEADRDYCAYQ